MRVEVFVKKTFSLIFFLYLDFFNNLIGKVNTKKISFVNAYVRRMHNRKLDSL